MYVYLRNCWSASQSGCTIMPSRQKYTRVRAAPYPPQHFIRVLNIKMTLTLAHTFKIISLCICMLVYMYVYVYTYTHHANTRYYYCYYITVLFSFLSQIGVLLLVVYFLLPLAFHFQFLWLAYHPPPGLAHTHSLMQESGWKDKRSEWGYSSNSIYWACSPSLLFL